MRNERRYPHRAPCRHDPNAVGGTNRHHSPRGIDQLVPIMKVKRDYVSRGIVAGQTRDLGSKILGSIKECFLARLQH